MNQYQNQMNYNNNTYQANQLNIRNKDMYYQINNNQQNYTNVNNNLYSYDKRLVLCLKYLGLSKYIPNFIKKGIRFEDFLSFSNNDLASFKIPPNIQHIIQKFILAYFNFGSLYTTEEIIQFFKTRKVKKIIPRNSEMNLNERNRDRNNNIKNKSVNQRNNNINNNYNQKVNFNNNNNIYQRNLNNNFNNAKKRPKSQSNKLISDPNDYNKYNKTPNNIKQKILTNNNFNNIIANKVNNFRTSSKKIPNNNNNIKRKNIPTNIYGNTTNTNSNLSSLPSNQNNFNIYTPSIDNFSHMAMKENSPQYLNMMKMANFKNININQLKKNLGKNFSKTKKEKPNNNNENMSNRNKIVDNKNENIGLSRSTSKDIIERMNEVLKKYESRKKSNNGSVNLNMNNKGYHSDGYLKEKNNINRKMNMNLEGYEINTYYAGDTSKFSSFGSKDNIFSNEIKKIRKEGNLYNNSKTNKAKKINEEQARKIEYLLSHGGNSSLKYNNFMMMNNYDINNDEEMSLISDNKNKTGMVNYNNLESNFGGQQFFSKKNNYLNQMNNNKNDLRQKNLLIQKQNYKNKTSKNKPNNFNTYASNRGNISSNYYQNNNMNNNIIHVPNQQIRTHKKEGPVQISVKNRKKIKNNNYINISPNFNNNINERGNNCNVNNNSMNNFSMGHKMQKNNNLPDYPFNNYLNDFVDMNNNIQQHKRNTKSYDKHINNRVYAGIHNINNNINNININNINYDGKRLSDGFNNFNNLGEIDMKMNYHRTQDNFYDPGNLLNNNDIFSDFY